ncbi:hypothetical protein F4678DRAFT_455668 [Xylaria arbuscula]|nr:hypothetical protein F4678DRAFT_455668 [Xylaria arbuscula]
MAARSNAYPVYTGSILSRQQRWQLGRKCGKYDFDQFRPIQVSTHFLGKGKIGEMEVACKFLFHKSRWGVLNPDRNPAGILYLDLVFTEPPGCCLRGATVILTLDEHDEDLERHFSIKDKIHDNLPVHVTEHGPHHLVGPTKTSEKLRTRQFIPSINAGGFVELGGIGQMSKVREVHESQWRFSSQVMPDQNGHATTLRWDLSESHLDGQPKHANTLHTAFAFQHDGQPFFIHLEVSGVLENAASNLIYKTKRKLRKFRFPGEPQRVTTLVNFGGRNNHYTQPLDEHAQMIPSEMVHANMAPPDQVQTLQTPLSQTKESVPPRILNLQEAETPSEEIPIPQVSTDVAEQEDMAKMKENALTLMALPKANPNRRATYDAYLHNEKPSKTPHTPPQSIGDADRSFDESSQTVLGSEHESEQPKIIQASLSVDRNNIRDFLREMGVFPALVQLVFCLLIFRVKEIYSSTTTSGSSSDN